MWTARPALQRATKPQWQLRYHLEVHFSNRPRSAFYIDKKQNRPQLLRFVALFSLIKKGDDALLQIVVDFVLETQELHSN